MARVEVVRDPRPPIKEVVLRLNLDEAILVCGSLGRLQTGGAAVVYGDLRDALRGAGVERSVLNDAYRDSRHSQ